MKVGQETPSKREPKTPLEMLLQELYDIEGLIWRVDEERTKSKT